MEGVAVSLINFVFSYFGDIQTRCHVHITVEMEIYSHSKLGDSHAYGQSLPLHSFDHDKVSLSTRAQGPAVKACPPESATNAGPPPVSRDPRPEQCCYNDISFPLFSLCVCFFFFFTVKVHC